MVLHTFFPLMPFCNSVTLVKVKYPTFCFYSKFMDTSENVLNIQLYCTVVFSQLQSPIFILGSTYCLCRVSHILAVCVWILTWVLQVSSHLPTTWCEYVRAWCHDVLEFQPLWGLML